jgi:hypothetical protein
VDEARATTARVISFKAFTTVIRGIPLQTTQALVDELGDCIKENAAIESLRVPEYRVVKDHSTCSINITIRISNILFDHFSVFQ